MFSDLLIHRVEVYARSGRRDRFGQPVDANPGQHSGEVLAAYPCRAHMKAGGLEMEERNIDVFVRVWEVFTDLSADIREDDAVRVIDPRDDSVLVNRAKIKDGEVVYDSSGPHHKEFMVWEQSGPTPARGP